MRTPPAIRLSACGGYVRFIRLGCAQKIRESLLHKIIRKYADRDLSTENYRDHVTDLAGVRALHLYREDWPEIHEFITTKWPAAETPKAFIRDGDDKSLYEDRGCATALSDRGYRSVHYSVKTRATVDEQIVEVQVRTLFAEGWSEIDHQVAYPNNTRDAILEPYLALFNRACGLADEMATGLSILRSQLDMRRSDYEKAVSEHDGQHDRQMLELRTYIAELEAKYKISEKEKQGLERRIELLSESSKAQQRSYKAYEFPSGITLGNTGLSPILNSGTPLPTSGITLGNTGLSPILNSGTPLPTSVFSSTDRFCDKCGGQYNSLLNPQCPKCAMTTITAGPASAISLVVPTTCSRCGQEMSVLSSVTGFCQHCHATRA